MNPSGFSSGCQRLRSYLAAQREALRRAIDENKWYLSERAGHDIGLERAKQDFYVHHLDRVCHEFRVYYCRSECASRQSCALASMVARIPSLTHRGAN